MNVMPLELLLSQLEGLFSQPIGRNIPLKTARAKIQVIKMPRQPQRPSVFTTRPLDAGMTLLRLRQREILVLFCSCWMQKPMCRSSLEDFVAVDDPLAIGRRLDEGLGKVLCRNAPKGTSQRPMTTTA